MNQDIRSGIAQAEFNNSSFSILAIEITIAAAIAGIYFKSWWVGGGLWLALIIATQLKHFAWLIIIVGSLLWCFLGFLVGSLFGNIAAQIVIGIIALFIGLGIHFTAINYADDMTKY